MAKLRAAHVTDADDLASVMRAAYAPFVARIADLPDVAAGLAGDIQNHDVWVAEGDSGLLGGVVISYGKEGAQLVNLAVHPDAGGKGVGAR